MSQVGANNGLGVLAVIEQEWQSPGDKSALRPDHDVGSTSGHVLWDLLVAMSLAPLSEYGTRP